ncbi:hypothetical protein BDW60DRAFT_197559 [Aspergillus nidulans var. acristatus]
MHPPKACASCTCYLLPNAFCYSGSWLLDVVAALWRRMCCARMGLPGNSALHVA